MTDRKPPKLAVWLLKRWASPYQRESLVGDLLEMFRGGRSRLWYWRQVIVALILAQTRAMRAVQPTGLGPALSRLVNVLLLAAMIALGVGSLTQADTTQVDSLSAHSR